MALYATKNKTVTLHAYTGSLLLLMFILVLGALVRFQNIGEESVDLEEYACVGGVDAPDWGVFFEEQRDRYPYGAPLAPALIYLWTRVAGTSIVAIRTLFACISLVALLLCYRLGRVFFEFMEAPQQRRAGLVTALCFALSPLHVFHAQEARMYALVSLFTLLAMMGMVEGLRGKGRGWWALHVCANAGLLASHYFTVFLLPVQGIAMIVWERRFTRRLLYWSLFQGLLLVTLLLWVSRIPRQAEDLYSYYSMPSLGTVLTHLLAKDSTTLSASAFFPSSRAWYWLPGHWGATLRGAHPYFDFALMGVSLAAFLAAAFALFYHLRQKNAGHAWTWLLLLLWVFLPTLLLVAVSWSWQPIYGSRYVMYSSFALYLIAGGLVSLLRSLYAYRAVLLLLIGIFGYQPGLALPRRRARRGARP